MTFLTLKHSNTPRQRVYHGRYFSTRNSATLFHNPSENTMPNGKEKEMKQRQFDQKNEIPISAADLERANLMGFDCLELHLLDQAAVVIPGEMTARELIEVDESLLKLTDELIGILLKSCSDCNNCGQQEPCAFMTGMWPRADPESRSIKETEDEVEFLRLSSDMQKLLQDRGVCLLNLEEKLKNGDWVYFNGHAIGAKVE